MINVKFSITIAIKQDFWNKNLVFCVMGNEIGFSDFSGNLV